MIPLYPLRFRLLVRRYLWGNRRLETCLGKPIGPGNDYAESWEVCDHGDDQSIVDQGPLAGTTAGRTGSPARSRASGPPLPAAEFSAAGEIPRRRPGPFGSGPSQRRTSGAGSIRPTWARRRHGISCAADPGSAIYAGLRPGVDRRQLADAIRQGTCEKLLHRFEPKAGDCLFIPAGTVHALGPASWLPRCSSPATPPFASTIGTASAPTASLVRCTSSRAWRSSISSAGRSIPCNPSLPTDLGQPPGACDKFIMDRWEFDQPQAIGGDDRFHIVCVLHGAVRIEGDPADCALVQGWNRVVARLPRQRHGLFRSSRRCCWTRMSGRRE